MGPPFPPVPPPDDPQYRVTLLTPFTPGCDGTTQGTAYVNAEVEPMVAVDPTNPNRLVGVWQQDRWSDGGARGNVTGVSVDGGITWVKRAPPFSRCTGGTFSRTSDPWVTFSPDGTAHQIALAFDGETFGPGAASAILVSRSTDGGDTWSAPATLSRGDANFFDDKESITADPHDSRYV